MAANIDFTLGEDDSHAPSHDDEMIARSTTCDNESSIYSEESGPFHRVFQNTTTDNGLDGRNLSLTKTHSSSVAGGNSSRVEVVPSQPDLSLRRPRLTPVHISGTGCTRTMNMMLTALQQDGVTSQLLRRVRPQYSLRNRRSSSFSKVSQTLIVI